jgi:hypothetical protein
MHIAGAATLAPGSPAHRLLWSPDERFVVSVGVGDGPAALPTVVFGNHTGGVVQLDAGSAAAAWGEKLEPGDTAGALELVDGVAALCAQAATVEPTGPLEAFALVLSAVAGAEAVEFIGQLFVRRLHRGERG